MTFKKYFKEVGEFLDKYTEWYNQQSGNVTTQSGPGTPPPPPPTKPGLDTPPPPPTP